MAENPGRSCIGGAPDENADVGQILPRRPKRCFISVLMTRIIVRLIWLEAGASRRRRSLSVDMAGTREEVVGEEDTPGRTGA